MASHAALSARGLKAGGDVTSQDIFSRLTTAASDGTEGDLASGSRQVTPLCVGGVPCVFDNMQTLCDLPQKKQSSNLGLFEQLGEVSRQKTPMSLGLLEPSIAEHDISKSTATPASICYFGTVLSTSKSTATEHSFGVDSQRMLESMFQLDPKGSDNMSSDSFWEWHTGITSSILDNVSSDEFWEWHASQTHAYEATGPSDAENTMSKSRASAGSLEMNQSKSEKRNAHDVMDPLWVDSWFSAPDDFLAKQSCEQQSEVSMAEQSKLSELSSQRMLESMFQLDPKGSDNMSSDGFWEWHTGITSLILDHVSSDKFWEWHTGQTDVHRTT